MPIITLPDGAQKEFDHAVTAMDVAESIGSRLAKAVIAAKINNQLSDASTLINQDASLKLLTDRKSVV